MTTGVADWRKGSSAAPKVTTLAGSWYAPSHGQWIGNSGSGAVGDTTYSLSFSLSAAEAACAHFQLHYLADNALDSAHMNGHTLTIGTSSGFATPYPKPAAVITAHQGSSLFGTQNQLSLVVDNSGSSPNPLGLYIDGIVDLRCSPPPPPSPPPPSPQV